MNKPMTAKELIEYVGIGGRYRGQRYLAVCTELVLEDENRLLRVTKWLYPIAAEKCGTNPVNLHGAMRTAIRACWNSSGRLRMEAMIGYSLDFCPAPNEFIDLIATIIRRGE